MLPVACVIPTGTGMAKKSVPGTLAILLAYDEPDDSAAEVPDELLSISLSELLSLSPTESLSAYV